MNRFWEGWAFFRVLGPILGFWFFLMALLCWDSGVAQGQLRLELRIGSPDGTPLEGASVKVSGRPAGYSSDVRGSCVIGLVPGDYRLSVSHQGFAPASLRITIVRDTVMAVELSEERGMLDSVVVSTGYQQVERSRLTGAYGVVDRKLLERRVGANLLERLEDAVPGLVFNRAVPSGATNISVRGQSTISANTDPLIVLDDFPFEGDLSAINPNDIESVTVLKDAAASSIWGARAGNGVIVVRTKSGKKGSGLKLGLNTNMTIAGRPDLFYQPRMSSSDYVDVQTRLFSQGFYRAAEQSDLSNVSHFALPELVDLLILGRDGKIDAASLKAGVDRLRVSDYREDAQRYLYRPMVNQQYAVNASGGSDAGSFYLGLGYDRGQASEVGNGSQRLSLTARLERTMLSGRLQVQLGLLRTLSLVESNASGFSSTAPYQRLADGSGIPLAVPRYRQGFVDRSMERGFVDWNYVPLADALLNDNTSRSVQERYDAAGIMKLLEGLKFTARYQFDGTGSERRNNFDSESYFVRNMVNTYTQPRADGSLGRPVPLGGILDVDLQRRWAHVLRGQLDLDRSWKAHRLTAIAGYERRFSDTRDQGYRLYGYQGDYATSIPVDYQGQYQSSASAAARLTIPYRFSTGGLADRFLSYYANAVYAFRGRYVLSGSARMDKSNLFGVATNQKGVPLYALGAAWTVSSEPFWKSGTVEMLKLRGSFGYNGNIDRSLSAQTTAIYFPASGDPQNLLIGSDFARIENPPNPQLRWERVRTLNMGVDVSLWGGKLSGNVDLYRKDGLDLIGPTPFPGSSGVKRFTGNFASTKTHGVDLMLVGRPFTGAFSLESNFMFSLARERVVDYQGSVALANYVRGLGSPMAGKPLYSVFSYGWAGLDPANGNPRGWIDGLPSVNYAALLSPSSVDGLEYHGSRRPVVFGAWRNTFGYKGFSLSVSISYRAGYYFRRASVIYGNTYGLENGHGDYALRWIAPGDEQRTDVPSVPAATDDRRDSFYSLSSVLVERGDHLRLQDLNLGYTLPRMKGWGQLSGLNVYFYANNIGLLYKKASGSLDPDYPGGMPPVRSYAFGLRKQF